MIFRKKRKTDVFLILDIGTEAVKCLISNKNIVLGAGLQYFDRYGAYNSSNPELEMIKKAAGESIKEACYLVSLKKHHKDEILDKKNWQAIVSFPPDIFKARVVSQFFSKEEGLAFRQIKTREKISAKEEKSIYKNMLGIAQNKVSSDFAEEFGILPRDISWVYHKILEIKIEGYSVPKLEGYEGKEMEFKILLCFLPDFYRNSIKEIMNSLGLDNFKIIHLAEPVSAFLKEKKANGLAIDVGGESTQIFGAKDGSLEDVREFNSGARLFNRALSQTLGLDEDSSRVMAEKHSRENIEKIKEIFLWEKKEWYNSLKANLDKMALKGIFPSNVFLFGGGSSLPEIKESLKENEYGLSDLFSLNIQFLSLKDFKNIEGLEKIIDNPQWIPPLLICYNINK